MSSMSGSVVLVSGVGPGLGREIAEAASREGAKVMLAARSADRLASIASAIDPSGASVAYHPTDISDPEAAAALVAATLSKFGRLDAVVHNAAVDTVMGGLQGANFADLDRVLSVNLYGTLRLTAAALDALAESGRGSVVIIGTQSSINGNFPQLFYAASKGALTSSMFHLAGEVGPRGIRVNSVLPGWMLGPPVEGFVAMEADRRGVPAEQVLTEMTAHMPLRHMATDGDVAEAAIFFASTRSKGITGQTLLVNAGEVMR
jgi:NAD(P)-dependent dehydrogenase (short-subunit alcohol dehydrogenase family)